MSCAITCFKAYDLRGRVPDELNTDVAYRVGQAFAQEFHAQRVVVGHDIRLTSPELCEALSQGLASMGCNVINIGQCGTEEIYFATVSLNTDGGICVTASHNPEDYNGMKFVASGARPVNRRELDNLRQTAERATKISPSSEARVVNGCNRDAYIEHLLSYIQPARLNPLRIVVNAGNGGAGAIIDALEPYLPFEFIKVHHQPDGQFPNGIPNPLLPENRTSTREAVITHQADLGIAWDGDFDRCFFFDETGEFIEGYYVVGLLAAAFLEQAPGEAVVHDPRLLWNTLATVEQRGGRGIQSRTGHGFIKATMREHDAIYGGEMSAHHYFRDFAYCDSGMIPWLLVVDLISRTGQTLSSLMQQQQRAFPCSGEINRSVADPLAVMASVESSFQSEAIAIEHLDGLSMAFEQWRFNLRASSTEPLLRLNVESRGDVALMQSKTSELLQLIDKKAALP